MNRKRRKELIRVMEARGDITVVSIAITPGGHLKVIVGRGNVTALVHAGQSPSDHRARLNMRSDARKALAKAEQERLGL